jgi:membrane protein
MGANSQSSRGGTAAHDEDSPQQRGPLRLVGRTLHKAWWDNIFSQSAAAAFWQTLSLPPLLLGLLGSLGYVGDWFGPELVGEVEGKILGFARTVFTPSVVRDLIAPTVGDVLTREHTDIISVGFLMSLWAGSSALASLVDSITLAHGQNLVRHTVWQRVFALLLYLVSLVVAVVVLPVIAIGPRWLPTLFPAELQDEVTGLIHSFYYPATGVLIVLALTTLYKVAPPRKLPWHRGVPGALLAMVVFFCSSFGLRLYFTWITTTGYTYGTLAAPIAYLLFAFSIGMAVIIGAQFNSAAQEMWPSGMSARERRRWQRLDRHRTAQRTRTERGYQALLDGQPAAQPQEPAAREAGPPVQVRSPEATQDGIDRSRLEQLGSGEH